jgi:hypothetical protein
VTRTGAAVLALSRQCEGFLFVRQNRSLLCFALFVDREVVVVAGFARERETLVPLGRRGGGVLRARVRARVG